MDQWLLNRAYALEGGGGELMGAQDYEPFGTVRREPVRNALALCVVGGYRVMFPENDQVLFLSHPGDSESLRVFDWPIIWCPNAT